MKAERNRKEKRRAPAKPPLTDDMRDLMAALAQNAADEGLIATLQMPWRNGWNAVRFGVRILDRVIGFEDAVLFLGDLARGGRARRDPTVYWDVEDRMHRADNAFLRATYRCAQIMLTVNGSGDGSIFNAVWEKPLSKFVNDAEGEGSERIIEGEMMRARCLDVLGVEGPALKNDTHDFYRRAFEIAWRNQLYHAAYALPLLEGL